MVSSLGAQPAQAQGDFPTRPIKAIVPFPAGGGIDLTARIAAQKLGEVLGQQIVVQNQAGGGGAIATDTVAKTEPDGYTLLYHSVTGIVHAAVTEKLPYDWLKDLAPVSLMTRFAPVMVISPTLPAQGFEGVHRADEGQPREIQLCVLRRRHRGSSRGRAVPGEERASTWSMSPTAARPPRCPIC